MFWIAYPGVKSGDLVPVLTNVSNWMFCCKPLRTYADLEQSSLPSTLPLLPSPPTLVGAVLVVRETRLVSPKGIALCFPPTKLA